MAIQGALNRVSAASMRVLGSLHLRDASSRIKWRGESGLANKIMDEITVFLSQSLDSSALIHSLLSEPVIKVSPS